MITKLSCAIIVCRCHQDDRGAYPALRPCPADTALGGVALRPSLGADRPHPRRPQGGALSDRRPDNCSAYENQPRSCRDPETLWNIIAKEAAHSHRAAAGQGRLIDTRPVPYRKSVGKQTDFPHVCLMAAITGIRK